ncbi:hypothetical protein [Terrisporobacter sp.]|uniref:hypothetical protein n=1 Tax=Terrisporobacter sp. TaxID=1965305 RepID=UPI0039919D14
MSENKSTKKSTRMTKNLSFKKHEKHLYDYINDTNKIPDASAFIKDLIQQHIDNEKRKREEQKARLEKMSNDELLNRSAMQQFEIFRKEIQKQLSGFVIQQPDEVNNQKNKSLQATDPSNDIVYDSNFKHDDANTKKLQELDL